MDTKIETDEEYVARRKAEYDSLSDEEKQAREERNAVLAARAEQVLTPFMEFIVQRKNDLVASSHKGADDITPWIDVMRDGVPVCAIVCSSVDRDQALDALFKAIPGYAADEIFIALDSHYSKTLTNPRTGKKWNPGEMQGLCDNEGACDLGIITDTIFILRVTRDGQVDCCNRPYHIHDTARTVAWITDSELGAFMGSNMDGGDDESHLGGFVLDTIWSFFQIPVINHELIKGLLTNSGILEDAKAAGFDDATDIVNNISDEDARLHLDIVLTKILLQQGEHLVILAAPNEEAAKVIDESFAEGPWKAERGS